MCSILSKKFYKKVRTLVLGGEAGRVKLYSSQGYQSIFAFGSMCICILKISNFKHYPHGTYCILLTKQHTSEVCHITLTRKDTQGLYPLYEISRTQPEVSHAKDPCPVSFLKGI